MKRCHKCLGAVDLESVFFRDECSACGSDLHVCLNCLFYDEGKANRCRESQAEYVRERDRANYCSFFQFKDDVEKRSGKAEGEKLWESLFKK
jgi:hypothetical protein